jgi:hypothetical protein
MSTSGAFATRGSSSRKLSMIELPSPSLAGRSTNVPGESFTEQNRDGDGAQRPEFDIRDVRRSPDDDAVGDDGGVQRE